MNDTTDRELHQVETLLRRAATSMPYPTTPDLASSVRVAINEERAAAARPFDRLRTRGWPAFAVSGALAAIVIALGALLAVPASRTAMADFFGLDHISFFEEDKSSPTPPVLSPDSFARPSSIDEVRRLFDFPIVLPYPDEPGSVYIQGEEFDAPIAIFVFDDYDIYETRLAYLQKGLGDGPVTEVSVKGDKAYWVASGGHIVQSLDAQGRVVIETRRTVERGTLLWEAGGITYRIESSLPLDDTIAVAETLR
jgi:hypothetical protein